MPIRVNNGSWVNAQPRCKNGASWVTPQSVWANDGGTWKKVWPDELVFEGIGANNIYVQTSGGPGNRPQVVSFSIENGVGPYWVDWSISISGDGAFGPSPAANYYQDADGNIVINFNIYYEGPERAFEEIGSFLVQVTDANGMVSGTTLEVYCGG